jgi:hypothetical protein
MNKHTSKVEGPRDTEMAVGEKERSQKASWKRYYQNSQYL